MPDQPPAEGSKYRSRPPQDSVPLEDETPFPPLDGDAIVITGPTASGKSRLALELAQRLDGEIISVDSIAVYRGMDIGTAKPTAADQARVPHHLIDVAWPDQDYSVAAFLTEAWRQIAAIRQRGKRPLLVGGTPLYLKGLLYGFDPGPPADWQFRQAVEADLQTFGAEALHQRLWQVDPLSAHRLHPTDVRRVTRALEVAYLTGQPLSHRQIQFEQATGQLTGRLFSLQWPRPLLHQRIAQRVDEMFQQGLVDEVRQLVRRYPRLSRTARIAVGYREVLELLQQTEPPANAFGPRAETSALSPLAASQASPPVPGPAGGQATGQELASTRQLVIEHTRQLARRQETWLRSLTMLQPLTVDSAEQLTALIDPLAQQLGR